MTNITIERARAREIARVCHEVNRAYCEATGDDSQVTWGLAAKNIQASAVNGVLFHAANPSAGAEGAHANWCEFKVNDGWTYGPVKDDKLKTHPCLVSYSALPAAQRIKDHLFIAVCRGMFEA